MGKYRLKVKRCKIKQGGSKTFQNRHFRNLEYLNIANLVNTRVAEIIKHQPHEVANHLLSVKTMKIEKETDACRTKQL